MAERNLDLNERVEASRDPHRVAPPIQFELADIKGHFDQSLDRIKNQYEVADSLKQDGKEANNTNRISYRRPDTHNTFLHISHIINKPTIQERSNGTSIL